MTKAKEFDCVEVKRRVQRDLLKKIRGGSIEDEFEALQRLAEELPLWKRLRKAKRNTPPTSTTTSTTTKPRKTG